MRSLSVVLLFCLSPVACVAQINTNQAAPPLQNIAFSDFSEGLPANGPSPLLFAPASPAAAAVSHTKGPVYIAPSVMAGRLQHRVDPVAPSPNAATHGPVVFEARISKTGCVNGLKRLQGSPALVASAQNAVRQWTYQPYLVDGHPTEVLTKVTVNVESVR